MTRNIISDAPGTAGPDSIELIKVGTDKDIPTSTSSLINEASKMVGLPMSSPVAKGDVKSEKSDEEK